MRVRTSRVIGPVLAGALLGKARWQGKTRGRARTAVLTGMSVLAAVLASAIPLSPVAATELGPPGTLPATTIAVGYQHACAVLAGGSVTCWGNNGSGQLGNGTTSGPTGPVQVLGVTDAVSVAVGGDHSCALRANGTISCWGDNGSGVLGNGTTSPSPVAVGVVGVTDAVAVVAGYIHSCALRANGAVSCWGNNTFWQLGNGTTINSSPVPVGVVGVTNAVGVSAGCTNSCVLRADGTVSCWGQNQFGQLGNGTTGNQNSSTVPVGVVGVTNAVGVTAGNRHACALRANGTVSCWGDNGSGVLGNGTTSPSPVPVGVVGVTNAVAVDGATNGSHSCALRADGTVSCWGANQSGQLGNGTTNSSTVPVGVVGVTNAVAVAVGGQYSCALHADGTVSCWGANDSGQFGAPGPPSSAVPVAVGVSGVALPGGGSPVHTCADVTTSGDVAGLAAAPTSLDLGARESAKVQVFAERDPVVVASNVQVDFDGGDVGSTMNASSANGGVLPPGTYCTFLLHFDPPGSGALDALGTVTFSLPIAGGALTDARLNSSDAGHGAPGTTYFTGVGRGVDDSDAVTFSSPNTLSLDMNGLNVVDNVRVWVGVGAPAPVANANGVASPGGSVATNSTVSTADPIGTSVVVPAGGPVSIAEAASPAGGAPVGYSLGDVAVTITAPAQTAAAPLAFTFVFDPSVLPLVPNGSGGTRPATAAELLILRNSVPVGVCPGSTVAAPDPCVTSASTAPDGTATIVVLTSAASVWTVAAETDPAVVTLGNVTVAEGKTTRTVDVPVTLSRPLLTATTVTASVSGGGARVPAQSVAVTIAAGETTGVLAVSVAGNTIDEPDVVATVTLTSAPGADIGSPPNTSSLTVQDDDRPAPVDPCPGGTLRPVLKKPLTNLGLGGLVCIIP